MTRRQWMLGLTAALSTGGCGSFGTSSYRFRMTVEVETPQGIRIGSSVMEERAYKKFRFTSEEHGGGGATKGEAVAIDLPDGPVFALLTLGDAQQPLGYIVTNALVPDMKLADIDAYVATVAKLGRGGAKTDLPRFWRSSYPGWPMMVRFRDIHDPKTVERVDPQVIGVKRIWVETTSDPVTTGIEKRLGWLESIIKRRVGLNGRTGYVSTKELSDNLDPSSFSTEIGR